MIEHHARPPTTTRPEAHRTDTRVQHAAHLEGLRGERGLRLDRVREHSRIRRVDVAQVYVPAKGERGALEVVFSLVLLRSPGLGKNSNLCFLFKGLVRMAVSRGGDHERTTCAHRPRET